MSSRLVLLLFSLCGIAATVSSRSTDPLVPLIGFDFQVPTTTAALVSSVYTLPFALGQPILGPLGDSFGKASMLRVYLVLLALCLLGAAVAPTFQTLLVLRFCSGLAAGGIIPACMASLGDRFQGTDRPPAISRFVTAGLMSQILSASMSGLIASLLGLRSVFLVAASVAVTSAGLATVYLHAPIQRASKFGCAYCLDMHTHEARRDGESEQRLYLLPTWRESPLYSDRERAALAWTEAVTLVSETHIPDSVYVQARKQFSEKELVDLTMLVVAINGWNRLAIAFRNVHPVRHEFSSTDCQEDSPRPQEP